MKGEANMELKDEDVKKRWSAVLVTIMMKVALNALRENIRVAIILYTKTLLTLSTDSKPRLRNLKMR